MSFWKNYKDQSEKRAKQLANTIQKREAHVVTRDDPAMAETLAQEMHNAIDEIILAQDENLSAIREDPSEFLRFISEIFGK